MKLWIFHHYATVPTRNGYIRPYRFSVYLKDSGIDTAIFASSYHHWSDENMITNGALYQKEQADGIPFVFVRTPSSASGKLARVRNMIAFAHRLFPVSRRYAKEAGRPDIILASSPHPLTMVAGIQIAKRWKIPCICEVRDLWPEAIFMASGLREHSLLGRFLIAGEHWIYRHADALIFTKEGDVDYLKERGWTTEQGGDIDLGKCFYINNGVELDEFERQTAEEKLPDPDLEDGTFKVVYTGAIRPINNVGNILEAARLLRDEDIRFLIYGDGNQREELTARANEEKLDKVKFKGFVERKYIPYILSRSSVNLLNYSGTKYNWSRGNSSNKLFEYLASGKPVISTVKTGYSIVQRNACGIELEQDTPEALAEAILRVKRMPEEEYRAVCRNAKRAAAAFDYRALSEKLLRAIQYAIDRNKSLQ